MATLPDITVTSDDFISLNTASGLAAGTLMNVQLKTTSWIRLIQSSTKPDPSSEDGLILTNLSYNYAVATVLAGGDEVWAICTQKGKTSKVVVQEL